MIYFFFSTLFDFVVVVVVADTRNYVAVFHICKLATNEVDPTKTMRTTEKKNNKKSPQNNRLWIVVLIWIVDNYNIYCPSQAHKKNMENWIKLKATERERKINFACVSVYSQLVTGNCLILPESGINGKTIGLDGWQSPWQGERESKNREKERKCEKSEIKSKVHFPHSEIMCGKVKEWQKQQQQQWGGTNLHGIETAEPKRDGARKNNNHKIEQTIYVCCLFRGWAPLTPLFSLCRSLQVVVWWWNESDWNGLIRFDMQIWSENGTKGGKKAEPTDTRTNSSCLSYFGYMAMTAALTWIRCKV